MFSMGFNYSRLTSTKLLFYTYYKIKLTRIVLIFSFNSNYSFKCLVNCFIPEILLPLDSSDQLQCKPLNVITLRLSIFYYINRLKTLPDSFYILIRYYAYQIGLVTSDHNKWLKTLTMITLKLKSYFFRYFSGYCHLFHVILLEEEVLPQLLLGIRDNHDSLVADSLRALADLVT